MKTLDLFTAFACMAIGAGSWFFAFFLYFISAPGVLVFVSFLIGLLAWFIVGLIASHELEELKEKGV